MPKYKLTLEVEVDCPSDPKHPESTITAQEVVDNLHKTSDPGFRGYAVCVTDKPRKLTGNMRIVKVTLHPRMCPHCGSFSGGCER